VNDGPGIGVFEYDGTPLEAWIAGRYWCVRFDGREVEARTVGEALEEVMGDSRHLNDRRRRDRITLEFNQGSLDAPLRKRPPGGRPEGDTARARRSGVVSRPGVSNSVNRAGVRPRSGASLRRIGRTCASVVAVPTRCHDRRAKRGRWRAPGVKRGVDGQTGRALPPLDGHRSTKREATLGRGAASLGCRRCLLGLAPTRGQ
jgi:hypothetical protein